MNEQNIGTVITDQPVVNIPIAQSNPVIPQTENPSTISTENKENVDKLEEVKTEIKPIDKPKHPGGRPCSFCPQFDTLMRKIYLYIEYCRGKLDQHIHIPYLEELCGYDYMDVELDTLEDWVKNVRPMPHDSNHKEELHAELSRTIKKLKTYQKLFLLRRTLATEGNVAGAIFQLKANHDMVETEKRLLGQDKDSEPLQITIVEEKKYAEDD